jgi:hypothetical protein
VANLAEEFGMRLRLYARWETETETSGRGTRYAAVVARLVVLAALVVLCLPLAALATDVFSDVPNDHPFHDAITAIYGARITTGCAAGIYCPEDNVTRGEMAAFMQRGFGRIAGVKPPATTLPYNVETVIATLTIESGGGSTGGTGFIKVDATFSAYNTGSTGCPCEVMVFLRHVNQSTISQVHYVTVLNDVSNTDSNASGAVTWAVPVTSAATQTFELRATQNSGSTNTVTVINGVTAIYAPFGGTGGATLTKSEADAPAAPDAPAGKP